MLVYATTCSRKTLAPILPTIMKRYVLFLLVLFLFEISFAQDEIRINFDEIKSKVENVNSESYYPKLLKRFNEFDNTLTVEENALIYYGFSFQEDYLKNQPREEQLITFAKNNDYESVVKEALKILKKNPVSLRGNDELAYALYKLGKPESEWKKYQKRFRDIRKVISLSGNGSSCENAFKVIYVSDEYIMIYDYFEIPKVSRQGLSGLCDRFTNEIGKYYKATEIYFDASRSMIRHEEIINKK